MSPELDELLQKAMALPPEARAALASSLIESLDQNVDKDAEAAWQHRDREPHGRSASGHGQDGSVGRGSTEGPRPPPRKVSHHGGPSARASHRGGRRIPTRASVVLRAESPCGH